MRHVEKKNFKREGFLEQKDKEDEDEKSIGRDLIQNTFRYYEKMRKQIQTSIVPPFEVSKSKGELRSNLKASFQEATFHPEINKKS